MAARTIPNLAFYNNIIALGNFLPEKVISLAVF